MADAFLKLVNGGKKSKGANLNGLLNASKQDNFFGINNNPISTKSNPFQKSTSVAPIRLDSGANNLDMLSKSSKKNKNIEDDDGELASSSKNSKRQSRLALPNPVALQDLQRRHSILVDGEDIPGLLPGFALMEQEYNIPEHISSNLTATLQNGGFGFTEPTPVQMQTIPALMNRRDVMAFAPTGSGKTIAFALPMVQMIYHYSIALRLNAVKKQQQITADAEKTKEKDQELLELGEWVENTLGEPAGFLSHAPPTTTQYTLSIHGIVLCPTRELALQTHRVYQKLLRKREEFFADKLEKIEILSQTDQKRAQAELQKFKKEEEDILYIQPTLLTKKWKSRSIKGFEHALLGDNKRSQSKTGKKGKTGAQMNVDEQEEEDGDFDEDDEDLGNNDEVEEEEAEDQLLNADTELQDCDDELNEDNDDENGIKGGNNEKKMNKFTILIATPLLLLSLLDRCHRIMKRDYAIQYQSYHAFQHYKTQRKLFNQFMTKAQEKSQKNTKKSAKMVETVVDDDEEFEVAVVNRIQEKDLTFPKVLSACQMLVIDECDRLLDLGFLQQVNNVLSHTQRIQDVYDIEQINHVQDTAATKSKKSSKLSSPPPTQNTNHPTYQLSTNRRRMVTALVSATITPSINVLSGSMLTLPIKVTIGEENVAQLAIKQKLMYVSDEAGKRLGMKQILSQGTSIPLLVFVQSKERAGQLAQDLQYSFDWLNNATATSSTNNSTLSSILGQSSTATSSRVGVLHADLTENERLNTITRFRIGEIWVLICTDVISRGLDFIHVKSVLNYDFPSSTTSYLHRIGRTGRGGYKGTAITFVTDDDRILLPNIAHIVKHSEQLQLQQFKEEYRQALYTELVRNGDMDEADEMYQIDSDDEGFVQYRLRARRDQLGKLTGIDVNKAVQQQHYQNVQNKQIQNQLNSKLKELQKKKNQQGDKRYLKTEQEKKKAKGPSENTMTDVNNLLISGRLSATALVLGMGDQGESGVADWMLELPMATAKEQQRLLYKAPIREDILHSSKNKRDKFKKHDMNVFHRKKGTADKLGITTRNEVGKILSDKLDHNHKDQRNKDEKGDKDDKRPFPKLVKGDKSKPSQQHSTSTFVKSNRHPADAVKRKHPPSRDADDGLDHKQKKQKRRQE